MKVSRLLLLAWEWLPIPAVVALVVLKTEWFTRPIALELWILFALIFAGNVVWLVIHRGIREVAEVHENYPGFRTKE